MSNKSRAKTVNDGTGRTIAQVRADEGEARREEFLRSVSEGSTIVKALAAAGWNTRSAYTYHRRIHPDWAARVDAALHRGTDENGLTTYDGTFPAFVARYFPDRRPHLGHQLRIVKELDDLGPRDVLMVLMWPEAGKTATLEDYTCKVLAEDPTHRFRYVSEGKNLAERVVGTCKRRFTEASEYPAFITRYGPFYEPGQEKAGRPWTQTEITILKNPATERDRNLVASSWTSAVYGSRIDTLVLDDLQSQRNYNQAEDITNRIRGTFFNRGIEMKTLIIGTRIGPGDFYERFLDAGLVTRLVELKAMDAYGEPTVPEFWDKQLVHNGRACCKGFRECPNDGSKLTPKEFMSLIRHQSGENTWWSSYMQQPSALERSTFGEYLDRCLDHDRVITHAA